MTYKLKSYSELSCSHVNIHMYSY